MTHSEAPYTEVDARGLACPMPIVVLARAVRSLPGGVRVQLLATDPAVVPDLQAWSVATGHLLLEVATSGGVWTAVIQTRE
ncbi:MAG: sulfurtransferase TusA family protein [Myxococcaceae bacterium]|nr:sulfurtransferase TusA family protein [Myxococcaceae bacterium]MCI0673428.1 sulfurtransferase TusA family protein [Myxococcaceae bacterium]